MHFQESLRRCKMAEWWNGMSVLQQALVCIAGSATLITIIQTILALIGFGEADPDVDFDIGDDVPLDSMVNIGGLRLFTFRGIIAGLTVGGWLAYGVSVLGLDDIWSILIGIAGMILTMIVFAISWRAAMRLQGDGAVQLRNAAGKRARVYIPIPASRGGVGKVTLTLQDRFVEADAVTDDTEKLVTDSLVEVVDIIDENTLLVKKTDAVVGEGNTQDALKEKQ